MLLTFALENWMSYRDETTFSMVATREKQHAEHLSALPLYRKRILPVSSIYGTNAAGKTGFIRAIAFAKRMITEQYNTDIPIPVNPFRLDPKYRSLASRFEFQILVDDVVYQYSFSCTTKQIIEEKLIRIDRTNDHVLYARDGNGISIDKSLEQIAPLRYIAEGTPSKQLILTNTMRQNQRAFEPVFRWFNEYLEVLDPNSVFIPFEEIFTNKELHEAIISHLVSLDTGIVDIRCEPMSFEHLPIHDFMKDDIRNALRDGTSARIRIQNTKELFLITNKDGELATQKVVALHQNDAGERIPIDFRDESDGTLRIFDLIPIFWNLSKSDTKKVYIIDELDRSLHSHITKGLLQRYLESCKKNTRNQLIFTVHDLLLMNQELMRRDEMWIADRSRNGISNVLSISDYAGMRNDQDVRRSYQLGRFGGIPRILFDTNVNAGEFECQ